MGKREELQARLAAAEEKLAEAEYDLSEARANKESAKVIASCTEAVRRQKIRVSNLRTDIGRLK